MVGRKVALQLVHSQVTNAGCGRDGKATSDAYRGFADFTI